MKLVIASGRNVPRRQAIRMIKDTFEKLPYKDEVTEIVHGNASGVDRAAGEFFAGKLPVKVFHADWKLYGKMAGPVRNLEMAKYADCLLACWDGKSRGTASMIKAAESNDLDVTICRYDTHEGGIE